MQVTTFRNRLTHTIPCLILSTLDRSVILLAAGGALTPLESFLKFGFVPTEAWERALRSVP
eukprot:1149097-Pelagomonas_calceolata.AAC.1